MPPLKERSEKSARRQADTPRATHSFSFVLDGDLDEKQMERLYSRCTDATAGTRSGIPYVAFDRAASTLADAVSSAMRDVEEATSLRVTRVEPEDLVSASDIARRTGRSRESIRLLIEGERGPGKFPRPLVWVGGRPVWAWADVAGWFERFEPHQSPDAQSAAFLSALNGALGVRKLVEHLPDSEARDTIVRVLTEQGSALALRERKASYGRRSS